MLPLQSTIIISVVVFMIISFMVFFFHERHHQLFPHLNTQSAKILPKSVSTMVPGAQIPPDNLRKPAGMSGRIKFLPDDTNVKKPNRPVEGANPLEGNSGGFLHLKQDPQQHADTDDAKGAVTGHHSKDSGHNAPPDNSHINENIKYRHDAQRGVLICHGERVDSEVIYWRVVPHDIDYESPITPHHGLHDDRYLTFEYDQGGWNNIRMGMETLIVVAHAMGRTLVIPPQQHLYLLGAKHKDPHDKVAHDEMGFEDFFDLNLLRSHRGFHVLSMEEFLAKEGVTGGLHGILPPMNSTKIWGQVLWTYLNKVADAKPVWMGRFIAFPKHTGDFSLDEIKKNETVSQRLKRFGGERSQALQRAHHIHFPAREEHRLLQHHYAFAFFADEKMQSFYRRFVRDFMRYRDTIQCQGAELVRLVRADSRKEGFGGDYYALHIRRGDFQYKDVKHSAEEILKHLRYQNGTPIIPPNSFVYISTDDPDGICKDCYAQRKPCTSFSSPKPVGCPEDTSWNAFIKFGWKLRFLRDYLKAGHLSDANPNVYGMVESIVCSRAKAFAGTYFSTFTGYIHRLRGYHGLGESTFYHSKRYVFAPQMKKSVGHGFSREWRAGWTDDGGELI